MLDIQGSEKYTEIFTSNISCTGNSILGLVGSPHIRILCGNTKIIRRVFADKLVVYSFHPKGCRNTATHIPANCEDIPLPRMNRFLLWIVGKSLSPIPKVFVS